MLCEVVNMNETPRANRLHIGLYGRRNAGKSSLINFLTGQSVAIVSDIQGTTTDPVFKNMELHPIGPVTFIDTAGLDDEGPLGEVRVSKTRETFQRADVALLVVPAMQVLWLQPEKKWLKELREAGIPVLCVLNKVDSLTHRAIFLENVERELGTSVLMVSTSTQEGRGALLEAIVKTAPQDFERPTIIGDVVSPGDTVALVTPQDLQAPKGRLILPQVQVIRDLLDHGALPMLCKQDSLRALLEGLKDDPRLVITDSQVFAMVNSILPAAVPLTSFSILMARYKGDLATFVEGARALETLGPGDKVLIAEACTHHALEDDIGREKIPRWLREKVCSNLEITMATGADLPPHIEHYSLIVHCGGCMLTRKQLMSRLIQANAKKVPITNYGILIAALNGILKRVTSMFEEVKHL